MRQAKQDRLNPATVAVTEATRQAERETSVPAADWGELGRRVLSEAMKRSMRELRRRNGHAGGLGAFHARRGGLS